MSITKTGLITGKEFNEGLSNFTVVGNPTITDGGVASGFSTSNYISVPYILPIDKSFEVWIQKVVTADMLSSTRELSPLGAGVGSATRNFDCSWYLNTGMLSVWINASSSLKSAQVTNSSFKASSIHTGDIVDIVCGRDTSNSTYYIKGRINNGSWVTGTTSSSADLAIVNKGFILGGGLYPGDSSRVDMGQINLSQFSISVDNKVIYSPAVNKGSISSYQITSRNFIEV